MTPVQKYRLSVVGILMATIYLSATEVADRWGDAWQSYRALEAKEARLNNPQNTVERRRELQAEVVALRASSATALGEIDRSENGVIAWIGDRARFSKVRIISLTPRKDENPGASDLQLNIEGRYHDIGRMVNLLERGPIAIRVGKLELGQASRSVLSAKLELHATMSARTEGM